ncbi:hypothetical protein UFOVP437_27 [uncultured Caudovirales phage]|uniref:Phage gp6-like head-tail connector protein n=1 Tax=uncultured Caudovirales phage TaxID=2100421 RepID=A0A6J5MBY6_9CAUD|nr:hypothetical protein UFOVP437_27 [uncultured Caudovirales phage]
MAVTLEEFQAYVGTDETVFPQECLTAGSALVDTYIGEVDTVPASLLDQAVLIASSELFHRRSAPNGVAQFASFDGAPIRVAKDPLGAVYPLLQRYVGYAV